MVSRRRFLQCTAAATASVAGCLGEGANRRSSTPDRRVVDTSGVTTQFQYDEANTGVLDVAAPASSNQLWRTRLDPAEGGVALSGDTLVVATGSLVGLDTKDGDERWRANVGHSVAAPPTTTDDTAYVPTWNGGAGAPRGVVAVDLADGSERWRAIPDVDVSAPLTLADGVLYAGGALDHDEVIAIDVDDGVVRWRFPAGEYATTAAVADGVAFVGGGKARAAFALDAGNGDELWRFDANERIWAAPTVQNGAVYVAGRNGGVWALDPETGDELWQTDTEGAINHSLAVTDSTVYVPTDGSLVALSLDGTERWTAPLENRGRSPTVTENSIVCTDRDRLYCFDRDDGRVQWRHDVRDRVISDAIYGGVRSPPIVADGTVYLVSHAGDVYAIGEDR